MVFEGDLTGSLPSGFVEGKHDGELATGIDVINKKITVTSDQFVIQNNDGEVTASVDADGVLKIGSGEFSGYMKTVPQVDPNNNSVTVTRDVLKKGGFFCFPTRDGSSRGTVTLPTSGDYLGTHLYIYSGSSVQTSGAKRYPTTGWRPTRGSWYRPLARTWNSWPCRTLRTRQNGTPTRRGKAAPCLTSCGSCSCREARRTPRRARC